MARLTLRVIGIYFVGSGLVMWIWPQTWFDATPGVASMGPFNLHFIRDIALIFAVSGMAVLHGTRTRDRAVVICGIGWPALHALYHVAPWFERGTPLDSVAAVNLVAIQLPVWTCLILAFSIHHKENPQ